jgi:hypothetical protein
MDHNWGSPRIVDTLAVRLATAGMTATRSPWRRSPSPPRRDRLRLSYPGVGIGLTAQRQRSPRRDLPACWIDFLGLGIRCLQLRIKGPQLRTN